MMCLCLAEARSCSAVGRRRTEIWQVLFFPSDQKFSSYALVVIEVGMGNHIFVHDMPIVETEHLLYCAHVDLSSTTTANLDGESGFLDGFEFLAHCVESL